MILYDCRGRAVYWSPMWHAFIYKAVGVLQSYLQTYNFLITALGTMDMYKAEVNMKT